jgi:signal transduction histidine kinase
MNPYLAQLEQMAVPLAIAVLIFVFALLNFWRWTTRIASVRNQVRELNSWLASATGSSREALLKAERQTQDDELKFLLRETEAGLIDLPAQQGANLSQRASYSFRSHADTWNVRSVLGGRLNLALFETMPNLLIGFGLMCTFIFLAVALQQAGLALNALDVSAREQDQALQSLIATAGGKFVTSIAGLLCSLLWNWRAKTSLEHLQTSIEMERAAIAREIHDDVGGSLTALKFDLAWIARHSDSSEVQSRVQGALETVTAAIESSQRIMLNLRPAILEQGLVAALQWMAAQFERRTGIVCMLRAPAQPLSLAPGVPLVAYRAAQEALTNVSKHAQATEVSIDLSMAGGVLSLEVSDNGRGLGADDLAKARSFGIRGLHERARTVGGWVDLSSNAAGTTLIMSVPLERGEAGKDSDDWGSQ